MKQYYNLKDDSIKAFNFRDPKNNLLAEAEVIKSFWGFLRGRDKTKQKQKISDNLNSQRRKSLKYMIHYKILPYHPSQFSVQSVGLL